MKGKNYANYRNVKHITNLIREIVVNICESKLKKKILQASTETPRAVSTSHRIDLLNSDA